MGLLSQHHEYATTRLQHLKSWPETGAAKLEAEILRHVLMQMAMGNTATIAVPVPVAPKPTPIPQPIAAQIAQPAIVQPTNNRMLIVTDRATKSTRIMSSKFDLSTVVERDQIVQDHAASFEFEMVSPSAAQHLVKRLTLAFQPQKVAHPTVSGNWYNRDVAGIVAAIVMYGSGVMGVRTMAAHVRDHGLRVSIPASGLDQLCHYDDRFDAIIRDYLLAAGYGCDGSVNVPEAICVTVSA